MRVIDIKMDARMAGGIVYRLLPKTVTMDFITNLFLTIQINMVKECTYLSKLVKPEITAAIYHRAFQKRK